MIKYVPHSYIDRKKYDQCIILDHSKLIYGLSWYLDLVCDSWDALVLNDYDAVWPLPVREKLGIKYFFRPYAVQQLGIFSKQELDESVQQDFLDEVQANCRFADIYGNESQVFKSSNKKLELSDNLNLTLALNDSYENIYVNYSSNNKRNIKKAAKLNWTLFENDNPEVLIELFKSSRGANLQLDEEFYRIIAKVMYACLHNNSGKLWTLYNERNDLCAGIFMLEFRGRQTLLFSGANEEAKKAGAMGYLLNEYIILQSAKKDILDFEGSNNEGLARFYSGFGASPKNYQRIKYNDLPFFLKWLK